METKPKVLAMCQSLIPSALVGVVKPLEKLAETKLINFVFKETQNVRNKDIAETDILICIRGSEERDLKITSECKRLGKLLVYYLDDDLLNVPLNANCYPYFSNRFVKENIISIMTNCNYLWTTNENLLNKYRTFFEEGFIVNAPALLLERQELKMKKQKSKIIIGFAGGIDHKFFLETLLDETVKILIERYGNKIVFEFFGAKPYFIEKYSQVHIPYKSNHNDYCETLIARNWDIGLAPLQDTDFNSCKYFNKFLEYGAIGAAGVYSNVKPYTNIIENGKNGLLVANNASDWAEAITCLIEDRNLRLEIVRNAREEVESKFSVSNIVEELLSQFMLLTTFKAPFCTENEVELPENICVHQGISKLFAIIKREKANAPAYIGRKILDRLTN